MLIKVDIGSKSGDPLFRDIIACYIAGYRTIEIYAQKLTAMQKRDIHSIVNKLIGPEILEETVNKVIIRDLLSSEELKLDHALKRIKNMTRSMINDAISSLINKNKELAIDVIQRDNDVDRLNLLVYRQFSEILNSRSIEQEINPVIAFNYMQAATNLERIADHASRIAEIASEIENEISTEIAERLLKFGSIFPNLMDESISILLNPDNDKANQMIEKIKEMKKQLSSITGLFSDKSEDKTLIRLAVAGSIERILDHIINISELAINLNNATLKIENLE